MLSTGQINDAFNAALGRMPNNQELAQFTADGRFDGDPGKTLLINSLVHAYNPQKFAEMQQQQSVDAQINQIKSAVQTAYQPFLDASNRFDKYTKDNPFNFDEAQAKASAKERLDPYYDQQLSNYTQGIDRQRTASAEDNLNTARELSADLSTYTTQTKQQVQDAIDASNKGFAGSGLFSSGAMLRSSGADKVQGQQSVLDKTQSNNTTEQTNNLNLNRKLADLSSTETAYNQNLNADKTTAEAVDVQTQNQDQQRQYQAGRAAYAGYPLASTNSILSSYGVPS